MTYLSIDVETTGLCPETDQIIEIAAVVDDRTRPVRHCPYFQIFVEHPRYAGTAYALAMNQRVFTALAEGLGYSAEQAMDRFWHFVGSFQTKFNMLGQNVGSFDLQFLKRLPGWSTTAGRFFEHRCFDVATAYATSEGMTSLGTRCNEIAKDFGIPGELHDALYDARVSLAAARIKWGIEI